MFWTIVGALLFVFVGIPIILLFVFGTIGITAAALMGGNDNKTASQKKDHNDDPIDRETPRGNRTSDDADEYDLDLIDLDEE
jgi:hypothetical protein